MLHAPLPASLSGRFWSPERLMPCLASSTSYGQAVIISPTVNFAHAVHSFQRSYIKSVEDHVTFGVALGFDTER